MKQSVMDSALRPDKSSMGVLGIVLYNLFNGQFLLADIKLNVKALKT